jgi:hydrogenase maturation protein HypF
VIARRFHSTMAALISRTCRRIRQMTGLRDVALSGGVFQNVRLLTETVERLSADGFHVLTHSKVPPNDGGLALGQVAVASALLSGGTREECRPCA